jgi:hypothetical protein
VLKKLIASLLIGCMVFSVVTISGCGKKDKEDKKEEKEKGKDDKK